MVRILHNATKEIIRVTLFYSDDKKPSYTIHSDKQIEIQDDDIDKLVVQFSVPVDLSVTVPGDKVKVLGITTSKVKKNKVKYNSVSEIPFPASALKIKIKSIASN